MSSSDDYQKGYDAGRVDASRELWPTIAALLKMQGGKVVIPLAVLHDLPATPTIWRSEDFKTHGVVLTLDEVSTADSPPDHCPDAEDREDEEQG